MKATAKKKPKTATSKAAEKPKPRRGFRVMKDDRLFTLEAFITDGPMTEKFCKANKEISRKIEMRGDQTLEELHDAIFEAFDRGDPHMYEFQAGGKGPMDPQARRYVLPLALEDDRGGGAPAKDLTMATIGSLDLKAEDAFGYWFDFGDDWWHQINVVSIGENAPEAQYPKIVSRTGDSPPQYVDWDE